MTAAATSSDADAQGPGARRRQATTTGAGSGGPGRAVGRSLAARRAVAAGAVHYRRFPASTRRAP
ncbi:hypothetical protein BJF77_15450 [Kocuria sp. CNJ-770]|nr:hypothetical protein BJF77_15450 [Kocuria sp. CNJ-770]